MPSTSKRARNTCSLPIKRQRTVAMLTQRLDQHRNRGQQQIVVKHVIVNADQAVVTDSVVTGKNNQAAPSAKFLAAGTDQPMEILEALKQTQRPLFPDQLVELAAAHAAPLTLAG